MFRRRRKTLIVAFIVIGLILSIQHFVVSQEQEMVSEREVTDLVSRLYEGEIESINLVSNGSDDKYVVSFIQENKRFEVTLDSYSGNVIHLSQGEEIVINETQLSEDDAKQLALQEVPGVIKSVTEKAREDEMFYEVVVEATDGNYLVTINQETKVGSSSKIEQEETINSGIISEEAAVEIALSIVAGKVDDIELEMENGLLVYEIEIETEQDEDVDIIINAYTGEVLSVTW
ncbi:PepSY domain-containing protein [Bacillus alkalicellulosilyticus]|uniref:PepSY domain-containing protein n=1 Tax=Alkalihalobacterium alkalicellulosilyticum TaxID=1912214 RepID=UPI0009960D6C|nr:PepSY domain-containing protein [Bacillus alkalicellulosilyticus]